MNYRFLLWIMRIISLLTFVGLIYFVFFISPYQGQEASELVVWHVIVFEVILFIFLSSIFSILLFWVRRMGVKRAKSTEIFVLGIISARQGILLGFCAIILLILQSFNILTWWDGLLAVGAILMIELYFLVK